MNNKPVCLLWYGTSTIQNAEARCLEKDGVLVQIEDEKAMATFFRKYKNEKALLTSFWVNYRNEFRVLTSSGIEEASGHNEEHGIVCMKRPIYSFRDTNGQMADVSREGWYKVTDSTTKSSQAGICSLANSFE